MGVLPGFGGLVGGFFAPPKLTFLGSGQVSGSATLNLGTIVVPYAGLVIVSTGGIAGSGRSISTVSIGGTNGTIHNQWDGGIWLPHGFASRAVAAGSHNVTVTFSASMNQAGAAVYLLTNYASATPHASVNVAWAAAGSPRNLNINIPANGVAIFQANSDRTINGTWTGATKDLTQTQYEAASCVVAAAETPRTVNYTWTGGANPGSSGMSWS